MRLASILLFAIALLSTSCVSFTMRRESRFVPISPDAIETVLRETNGVDLTRALELFGAPLWVFEAPVGDSTGSALAWGSYQNKDRGLRFSIPVTRGFSASFDYQRNAADLDGVVMFFDEEGNFDSWRTGLLRDLTAELRRRRPQPVP